MQSVEIKQLIASNYPDVEVIDINTDNFVFEERVKHKCFHCKNYNVKWTCPPRLPAVDYKQLFGEYEHAVVVYTRSSIENGKISDQIRSQSTNTIHKALLYLEGEMYKRNNSLALSFIGGSCKLCKNGCNPTHCVNPALSRVPWEATGVNICKTLKSIGIEVTFPPTDYLYRYGLFLW